MKHRQFLTRLLSLTAVGFVAIVALVVCAFFTYNPRHLGNWFRPAPPASTQNPPIYPGAQEVEIEALETSWERLRISYNTNAKPQDVIEFYGQTLQKDGWRTDNSLVKPHFYWIEGCPVFGLDLELTEANPGETSVKLRLTRELCH